MTQRYLIAAEFLRLVVEVSAAHSRAEVAGIILHIIHGIENVRFKHCYRNVHHSCVCLDYCAVLAAVAGIHDQEHKLEIKFAVALYLLEQLRHQHGILAAGNTHGYLVTRLEQLVLVKSLCKLAENTAVELLGQAAFNLRSAVGAALECDLMTQPAHIASDEVNSVAALGTEPFRDLLADNAAAAADNQGLSVGQWTSSGSKIVGLDVNGAVDMPQRKRGAVADVIYNVLFRGEFPEFFNGYFLFHSKPRLSVSIIRFIITSLIYLVNNREPRINYNLAASVPLTATPNRESRGTRPPCESRAEPSSPSGETLRTECGYSARRRAVKTSKKR